MFGRRITFLILSYFNLKIEYEAITFLALIIRFSWNIKPRLGRHSSVDAGSSRYNTFRNQNSIKSESMCSVETKALAIHTYLGVLWIRFTPHTDCVKNLQVHCISRTNYKQNILYHRNDKLLSFQMIFNSCHFNVRVRSSVSLVKSCQDKALKNNSLSQRPARIAFKIWFSA